MILFVDFCVFPGFPLNLPELNLKLFPSAAHCSGMLDTVHQIQPRLTHTKTGVLVIQQPLLNKNNLYFGPPRSTSNGSDFFLKLVTTQRTLYVVIKKKSELLLVDLGGPKYRFFLFRRVYWITRTPVFVWVGLGCIICWTVLSISNQCVQSERCY